MNTGGYEIVGNTQCGLQQEFCGKAWFDNENCDTYTINGNVTYDQVLNKYTPELFPKIFPGATSDDKYTTSIPVYGVQGWFNFSWETNRFVLHNEVNYDWYSASVQKGTTMTPFNVSATCHTYLSDPYSNVP